VALLGIDFPAARNDSNIQRHFACLPIGLHARRKLCDDALTGEKL
jgi:hypothetical protein